MRQEANLILYRGLKQGKILEDIVWIMENYHKEQEHCREIRVLCCESLHNLIELSASHGFEGNLWQNYLTFLMVNHENAYSRACEMRGGVSGTINELALHDFQIFQRLFAYDFHEMATVLGMPEFHAIKHYQRSDHGQEGNVFNRRIRDRICDLSVRLEQAKTVTEFQEEVTEFYREFGVGKLGLHKAFRVEHEKRRYRLCPSPISIMFIFPIWWVMRQQNRN